MHDSLIKYIKTKKNLKIRMTSEGYAVRYHQTDIIEVRGEDIVLRNGGWFTPSTKRHMNAALAEWHMHISQTKKVWYLHGKHLPQAIVFQDNMTVPMLDALI